VQLRLGFLSIFGMAMFLTPVPAIASDNAQPYKATTVDECIQEKECVWYAYSRALSLVNVKGTPQNNQTLYKRINDVTIRTSKKERSSSSGFSQAVSALSSLYTRKIDIVDNQKANTLFVFTNDIEGAYLNVLNAIGQKSLNSNQEYVAIVPENRGPSDCSVLKFINSKSSGYFASYAFIKDEGSSQKCMIMSLYNSFGFSGRTNNIPFSIFSDASEYFTQLDLFMFFLLFQPEFKNGDNYEKTRTVFNDIFEEKKKLFLKN